MDQLSPSLVTHFPNALPRLWLQSQQISAIAHHYQKILFWNCALKYGSNVCPHAASHCRKNQHEDEWGL